jgi:hypothetical protein
VGEVAGEAVALGPEVADRGLKGRDQLADGIALGPRLKRKRRGG